MIIKNKAFIFNFLPHKLSITITIEKLSFPNGRKALAGPVLHQSWTVTIQIKSDCNESDFLKRFSIIFF